MNFGYREQLLLNCMQENRKTVKKKWQSIESSKFLPFLLNRINVRIFLTINTNSTETKFSLL